MRVLQSLILSIVLLVSTTEATENLFVNFIPFSSTDCSGEPTGVGFSGLVFTCFTFDNLINYVFKPSQNGMVTLNKYKAIDTQTECKDLASSFSTSNGNCVSAGEIGDLNSMTIPSTPQGSYRMELSNNFPLIVPNSVTTAYSGNQCNSIVPGDSALLYEYYTNGTFIHFNGAAGSYENYCENGQPYATDEQYAPYNTYALCVGDTSFFNSSSEIPSMSGIVSTGGSGDSTANNWSDVVGTGSISGGGSGSSSNSESASSSSNSDSSYAYSYYSVYCSN